MHKTDPFSWVEHIPAVTFWFNKTKGKPNWDTVRLKGRARWMWWKIWFQHSVLEIFRIVDVFHRVASEIQKEERMHSWNKKFSLPLYFLSQTVLKISFFRPFDLELFTTQVISYHFPGEWMMFFYIFHSLPFFSFILRNLPIGDLSLKNVFLYGSQHLNSWIEIDERSFFNDDRA